MKGQITPRIHLNVPATEITHAIDEQIRKLELEIERLRKARALLVGEAVEVMSRHEVMTARVLQAMHDGYTTHSEIMAAINPTPLRHEVGNALRDLEKRGKIARTGRTGEAISGRGRAPQRYRLV